MSADLPNPRMQPTGRRCPGLRPGAAPLRTLRNEGLCGHGHEARS
jgi:hypothetical protein